MVLRLVHDYFTFWNVCFLLDNKTDEPQTQYWTFSMSGAVVQGLKLEFNDSDDEDLCNLVASDFMTVPTNDLPFDADLKLAALGLPSPETPVVQRPETSRFSTFTEDDLLAFEDAHQSKSTKANTKSAMIIFQDTVHTKSYINQWRCIGTSV